MKNATLRFELRKDRAFKGKHPIVVKLYSNRKNKYISTIFKVESENWCNKKERTLDNQQINNYLNGLSTKFNQYLMDNPADSNLNNIAAALFDSLASKSLTLLHFISNYIEIKAQKNEVISKTMSRYKRVEKVLTQFLTDNKNTGMLLANVNVQTINLFDAYIKYNLKVKGRPMEKNTINKYHSVFRTMLIQAVNEERLKVNPYNLFKLRAKPTHRQFLSDEELELFKSNSFESDKNEKVRLIYLFSCFTGIRFEDAQQLKTSNIKRNSKGETYLSFISSKSLKQQEIPILTDAIEVINKLKSKFDTELSATNSILPQISNQKFNDYLKAIAVRIGIDKELTHHTARHTFATYMLNRGVAPYETQRTKSQVLVLFTTNLITATF
ncbi:MAG: phage integrase SAM-like domain-containing protein [Bacteroidia bacterium]